MQILENDLLDQLSEKLYQIMEILGNYLFDQLRGKLYQDHADPSKRSV